MKTKALFVVLVSMWVLALADPPIDSRDVSFYAEKLLKSRTGIEETGYTPIDVLKERLEKLRLRREGERPIWLYPGSVSAPAFGSPATEATAFDQSWRAAGYIDIPDMLINEDGYDASFNQGSPSVCMFPDTSFVTVWEDERNGDLDIFAQTYGFDGTALGLNSEVGQEDFPKDQYSPRASLLNDTSFVVVWVDEENFDIYGKIFAKDLSPVGEAFLVNDSPLAYSTWSPSVCSGLDGSFVVVWEDTRSGSNIYARRFDLSGTPLGISFKVNDDDGSMLHTSPEISVGSSGNFVIAWEDFRAADADIYAQRFDSGANKVGGNVLVNVDSLNEDQYTPSVSVGENDRFMVSWVDLRRTDAAVFARSLSFDDPVGDTVLFAITSDGSPVMQESPPVVTDTLGRFTVSWAGYGLSDLTIYAQRFDSLGQALTDSIIISDSQFIGERHDLVISGSPAGSFVAAWMDNVAGDYDIHAKTVSPAGVTQTEISPLNDDLMGANQSLPRIAVRSDGGFMVVWEDRRRGSSDIFMKRFDQDAQPLGNDHMVNDSTARVYRGHPDVACDADGNFAVVWEDTRGSSLDVYAQLFDQSCNPDGENLKVSCSGMSFNSTPRCDMSPAGDLVVVWSSSNGTAKNVYGRLFSPTGLPLDTCFQINDDTVTANHLSPAVAMDSTGRFVVAWQDGREGPDHIYLQRFASDGARIGTNFALHTDRPDPLQYNVDVDLNQIGDFVVTWIEPYTSSTMIYAQRYDSSGSPIDTNLMISDDPSAFPQNPRVRVTDDGYALLAWTDHRGVGSDVYSQTLLNGVPQGPNHRVNSDEGHALQDSPDIGIWNSRLLSVWRDNRIPGLGFSIYFNRMDYTQTAVEEEQDGEILPANFGLSQNYPNPFNPTTAIKYFISPGLAQSFGRSPVHATLTVHNVLGQRVRTLVDEEKLPGEYEIIWDGRNDEGRELASGIYFCRLRVQDQAATRKLILLR